MADEVEDFEEFWKEIRPQPTIVLVSDRPTDIKNQLLLASEKTSFELIQKFKSRTGNVLTIDLFSELISEGVRIFMEKWSEGLRNQDLSGLVEIVLEGQQHRLTPDEMRGFVQALPGSLIDKIVSTAIGSGTGIHALMALEKHRRNGGPNYTIGTVSGRVIVRFQAPEQGEVEFGLYERFDLDAPKKAQE